MTDSNLSPLLAPREPVAWRRGWRRLIVPGAIIALWLLSGFFIVNGNEAAVVRVCGRAERQADGSLQLRSGGLYWHWPRPLATVDRVNVNEVRTVTVGSAEVGELDAAAFLKTLDPAGQSQLLSGDKNVLHVQLNVLYRVSREHAADWLYSAGAVEQRLQRLASSVLADVVLRCGVDFVHTLGHDEIRRAALSELRRLVARDGLGLEVEDVTVAGVAPPVRVKAQFVDVMNARADRETSINRARAYAEQQQADAKAVEQRLRDEAQSFRQTSLDLAQAEAESFEGLLAGMARSAETTGRDLKTIRQLTARRLYLEAVEDVLSRLSSKVVVGTGQKVDITFQNRP